MEIGMTSLSIITAEETAKTKKGVIMQKQDKTENTLIVQQRRISKSIICLEESDVLVAVKFVIVRKMNHIDESHHCE